MAHFVRIIHLGGHATLRRLVVNELTSLAQEHLLRSEGEVEDQTRLPNRAD